MIKLYHFTTIHKLGNIIKSKYLKSSNTYCIKKGIYLYPSFTYKLEDNDYTLTMLKTYGYGIIKLNQSILLENYWIGSDNQENKIHNYCSKSIDKLIINKPQKGEILIIKDKINVFDYLEEIKIPSNMPNMKKKEIKNVQSLNIPIIEYDKKIYDK